MNSFQGFSGFKWCNGFIDFSKRKILSLESPMYQNKSLLFISFMLTLANIWPSFYLMIYSTTLEEICYKSYEIKLIFSKWVVAIWDIRRIYLKVKKNVIIFYQRLVGYCCAFIQVIWVQWTVRWLFRFTYFIELIFVVLVYYFQKILIIFLASICKLK